MELSSEEEARVLGLRWMTTTDELTFRVVQPEVPEQPIKRQVLSNIAQLYDPNGFLAPIMINAKILMQDLWRLTIDWDQAIPPEVRKRWCDFYLPLVRLPEVTVPRWLGTTGAKVVQLHGFADASAKAYGAVIYTRVTEESGKGRCQLLVSKSRVAPTSTVSIPRLELAAAELLGRLMRKTIETCEMQHCEYFLWTDSTVVLHWLAKEPCDLKAFVANRVASIQKSTNVSSWAHIASGHKPADLLSRGMTMDEFVHSEHWFKGPAWLSQGAEQWPRPRLSLDDLLKKQIELECKLPTTTTVVGCCALKHEGVSLIYKHEDWSKIMRLSAYVLRFAHNCRAAPDEQLRALRRTAYTSHMARPTEHGLPRVMLSQSDIRRAENHWARVAQQQYYSKEIACRRNREPMPEKSAIAALNPILNQDTVLCVGGRLGAARRAQHQIIIPGASRLGWLLLHRAHRATLHGGVQAMIAYIRTSFWIPCLRSEARRYIKGCTTCVRMAEETATQMMGSLPADRVLPARAFLKTGVDYAGPFTVRSHPGRPALRSASSDPVDKGYVVVFVCLVTRAVHLEAVMGMTSEAFIAAFTRFVARRGHCAYMYSDNGTNFVGADRAMRDAIRIWQQQNTLDFVQSQGRA